VKLVIQWSTLWKKQMWVVHNVGGT
jgi:hypothetical protein